MTCTKVKYIFLTSILLFIASCAQVVTHPERKPAATVKPIHLVFDIDWTIVSPISATESYIGADEVNIIEVHGHRYKINNGFIRLLEYLSSFEFIEISYFSGGTNARNIELLQKIKLPDGNSAYDLAFRVLGKENLTQRSLDSSLKFSQRFKKDLRLVSSDLENVFLFEDDPRFALNMIQSRSVVSLGSTYYYFPSYADAVAAREDFRLLGEYIPGSHVDWFTSRNRLIMIHHLIREGLEANASPEALRKTIAEIRQLRKPEPLFKHTNLNLLVNSNLTPAIEKVRYFDARKYEIPLRTDCVNFMSDVF